MRALQLIACFGLALGASRADAQAVSLTWQAPPECPRASAVEASISQLASAAPSSQAAPVQAGVRITRTRGRYQLRLQLAIGSHRAERRLHAAHCDELSEAVVRLIAVALEAEVATPGAQQPERVTAEHGEPAHRLEGEGEARPEAGEISASTRAPSAASSRDAQVTTSSARATDDPERERTQADPSPERRSTLRVVAKATDDTRERALHGGASAGVFAGGPSAAQAALGAFLGWSSGWSYTQARFSGLLPRRVDFAPGASADVWSLALDLTQCALWGGSVRAGPCLALSGLRTSAEVRGLSGSGAQAGLWASASAGAQLFWRITLHLELSLSVSAGIPISPRPRFTVAELGPVATAKTWSSDARLGLSFRSR